MSLNDAGEFLLGGRENLPQRVSEGMLRMIRNATFKPGERLPTEPQLAATFGVSRNVVREAVATLRSKGILVTRRGIGTFVSETALYPAFEIHPDDLLEPAALMQIFQLRLEVESGAAAIAARERSAEQLELIGSALIRVNESAPNWEQGAETAVDFHLAIAQATNNAYFEQLMAHLRVAIHQAVRTLRYLDDGKGRTQQIESEHRAIYEAIRQSDADAARTAMRAHLQSGMYNYQRIFRERKAQ